MMPIRFGKIRQWTITLEMVDQGWSVLRAVFTIIFCDTNFLFGKILESYSKIV